MNKIAVIFGSTGLIGKSLLKKLTEDKRYAKIIVFNRKTQNYTNNKIEEVIINFDSSEINNDFSNSNEAYCCIGSTMKKSKTKTAFKSVDYDIPVKIAESTVKQDINKLIIVSSIGAKAESNNFYLQTKGKMEQAVLKFPIDKIHFLRPSMLLGKRDEKRLAEKIGQVVMNLFSFVLVGKLKKYKAIKDETVAKAMINIANSNFNKTFIESDEIHELA